MFQLQSQINKIIIARIANCVAAVINDWICWWNNEISRFIPGTCLRTFVNIQCIPGCVYIKMISKFVNTPCMIQNPIIPLLSGWFSGGGGSGAGLPLCPLAHIPQHLPVVDSHPARRRWAPIYFKYYNGIDAFEKCDRQGALEFSLLLIANYILSSLIVTGFLMKAKYYLKWNLSSQSISVFLIMWGQGAFGFSLWYIARWIWWSVIVPCVVPL